MPAVEVLPWNLQWHRLGGFYLKNQDGSILCQVSQSIGVFLWINLPFLPTKGDILSRCQLDNTSLRNFTRKNREIPLLYALFMENSQLIRNYFGTY
jgi:hypothetical protein